MTATATAPGSSTLVFTDIEGSTRLLRAHGETYDRWLVEHFAVLLHAVTANAGREINREGDALVALFPTASGALAACLDAQRAFAVEPWLSRGLKVRIGVHTGEARSTEAGWVGLGLHQAARIVSCANGGQTICSDVTAAAVGETLTADADLVSLGKWLVRDFDGPERLWQVVGAGVPSERLLPRAVPAGAHNLPPMRTSFVGRDHELAHLTTIVGATRLTTLTGAGGVGKTRLAFETVRQVATSRGDGAAVALLAGSTDTLAVVSQIATALGVRAEPNIELIDTVLAALQARDVLLVLDNCEHIAEIVADVIDLILDRAPSVTILATSRRSLDVYGEQVYAVETFAVPDPDVPIELLAATDALLLFADRAALARSGFVIDGRNAGVCVAICAAVDGLPLAIELAAARLTTMDLDTLAERITDTVGTLVASRSRDKRQLTVTALVMWSYELLPDDGRALFRLLSTFRGGFTTEAAEAVCGPLLSGGARPVGEILDELAASSLISEVAGRFRMLVVIRDVARDLLGATEDMTAAASGHLAYFSSVSATAASDLDGPRHPDALARLDDDNDNCEAALDHGLAEAASPELLRLAADLATALAAYWQRRGRAGAGRERMRRVVADGGATAGLYAAMSGLDRALADSDASFDHATAALALLAAEQVPDRHVEFDALISIGIANRKRGEADAALAIAEQVEALAAELDDPACQVRAADLAADVSWLRGDLATADQLLARAMELCAAHHLEPLLMRTVVERAQIALDKGDLEAGSGWAAESIQLASSSGDLDALHRAHLLAALFATHARRLDEARNHLDVGLAVATEIGARGAIARIHRLGGWVSVMTGDFEAATAQTELALRLAIEVGDRLVEAAAANGLGGINMEQRNYHQAAEYVAQALAIFEDLSPVDAVMMRNNLAEIALESGDWEHATELLVRSLGEAETLGLGLTEAMSLSNVGYLAIFEGRLDDAERWLGLALERTRSTGDIDGECQVEARTALLLALQGREEAASAVLDSSLAKDPTRLTSIVETAALHVFLQVRRGGELDVAAISRIVGMVGDHSVGRDLGALAWCAEVMPAPFGARLAELLINRAGRAEQRVPVPLLALLERTRGTRPTVLQLPHQAGDNPSFAEQLQAIVNDLEIASATTERS